MFYLFGMIGRLFSSLVFSLISLAIYLISSYAFYKVAKIRSLPNAWLAFIPFFGLYMTGLIADSMKYNHYKINRYISDIPLAYVLPIASLISGFLPLIPLIGGLATMVVEFALWAAELMVYYFVFSLNGEPKMVLPFTALSIIPVVGPCLVLYVLKDRRY